MSAAAPKEKKLIRAPSNLILKLNEAANRQGKTFYSYVTEILEQAVRACEMKNTLKEIIDLYEVLEVHKKAGTVFTPKHIIEYLTKKAYQENGETLQQVWYQNGRWYGAYLKERFDDPIEALVRLLKEGRLDLNEVSLERNPEMLELKCISVFLSQERTVLTREFVEGAMHSLGCKIREQECFKGIIRLRFLL